MGQTFSVLWSRRSTPQEEKSDTRSPKTYRRVTIDSLLRVRGVQRVSFWPIRRTGVSGDWGQEVDRGFELLVEFEDGQSADARESFCKLGVGWSNVNHSLCGLTVPLLRLKDRKGYHVDSSTLEEWDFPFRKVKAH